MGCKESDTTERLTFPFFLCHSLHSILKYKHAPHIFFILSSLDGHLGCLHILACISESEVKVKSLSCVRLFVTPWTVAYQAPLSMGFSRQEYWSGLPFPSPGHLPNPGIKPGSPTLEADTLTSEPPGKPKQMLSLGIYNIFVYCCCCNIIISLTGLKQYKFVIL